MNTIEKTARFLKRFRFASSPRAKHPRPVFANRKSWRILGGIATLALIGGAVFGYWYFFIRGTVFSDDARFSGHMSDLSPEICGTIDKIFVREGNFVKAGDEIFSLDDGMLATALLQVEDALASARASVEVAKAQYERMLNGNRPEEVKEGEANLHRLNAEETLACSEHERYLKMHKSGSSRKRIMKMPKQPMKLPGTTANMRSSP